MQEPCGPLCGDTVCFECRPVIDPADTRECDGYPALAAPECDIWEWSDGELTCCGDPGDCSECGPSRANVDDE